MTEHEGDDVNDHMTPAGLLLIYEILEWQAAVEEEAE